MEINFCFDDVASSPTLGYPNLARKNLKPDEFDHTWPRTLPLRLLVYMTRNGHNFRVWTIDQAPKGSWYPVALGWHDFHCDYIALMQSGLLERIRRHQIRLLVYYHEGDNPQHIKTRWDYLCELHDIPKTYLFVSANGAADRYDNLHYFPDHEYFFEYVNRRQHPVAIEPGHRPFVFTVLNRTHKWWRASVMSDLLHDGLLEDCLWSYNTQCTVDDREEDNPIELDSIMGWRDRVQAFIDQGPYICDTADAEVHNDHRMINVSLHHRSYCHVVVETMLDADQSQGSFLTEKTYKCIKFGQPFVIVGTPGSLAALRDQGYRVFDHALDNSYDKILDNTQRWMAVKKVLADLRQQDLDRWLEKCWPDVLHNQANFYAQNRPALNRLLQKLSCKI